eukprot:gnl/TRDRNA2_/TRDRNA2_72506_c0_seq1.p1 gnl/TRDRNA2_/TRDRNA2_72506_c0~~gnl/TRDRNA2_/TRDRNA2_72506_c0_seq1.p1  ORF type:complete len:144 (+),score=16.67 gnl/TRDRNA2_/TRDRNA2_72506_c0_seq1:223-654(+)
MIQGGGSSGVEPKRSFRDEMQELESQDAGDPKVPRTEGAGARAPTSQQGIPGSSSMAGGVSGSYLLTMFEGFMQQQMDIMQTKQQQMQAIAVAACVCALVQESNGNSQRNTHCKRFFEPFLCACTCHPVPYCASNSFSGFDGT